MGWLKSNEGNKLNLPEYVSEDGKYAIDCEGFSPDVIVIRILPLTLGVEGSALGKPSGHRVTVSDWLGADIDGVLFASGDKAVLEYVRLLRSSGLV